MGRTSLGANGVRILASFGWVAALLTGGSAFGAPITFENASDYDNTASQTTGFFRDVQNGGNLSTVNASGNTFLQHAGAAANISAGTVYDLTPGDATAATHSNFVNEQITVDFRSNNSASSFGVYARLNSTATVGYGIVLNVNNSGSNDQIRIFDSVGTDATTGGVGTALLSNTSTTALQNSTWYTLVAGFENLTNGNVQITARVYAQGDVNGTPLMNFSTVDSTTPLIAAGQLGLRFGDNNGTAAVTADADNFEIGVVPEPTTTAAAGLTGLFALTRRRRITRRG